MECGRTTTALSLELQHQVGRARRGKIKPPSTP
jgi:hypothetical protein